MTTSVGMEEDRRHVTEKILDLTLEIIYLLTGEDFKLVKNTSGEPITPRRCLHGASPITEPPPHRLTTEVNGTKKILEVTKKMIELLTGEVPIRCQDVSVYFSMEEWEYLEGHRDLYKDVVMENEPPLTSPDGSRKRNPPERCPRPLYSRDPTQEDLTVPHHDQGEKLKYLKAEIKEEEEETLVCGAQQSMEEEEMMVKCKQEESSLHEDTNGVGFLNRKRSEEHAGDDDITQHSPGVNPITHNRPHRPSHSETSMDPSHPEESSDQSQTVTPDIHPRSRSEETSSDPSPPEERHEGDHTAHRLLSTFPCGKSLSEHRTPLGQQRSPKSERPFSCPVCGKSFITKARLNKHQRIHTGERPFSCPECGKAFTMKGDLLKHRTIHTGERPFPCSECEKCFLRKGDLLRHQRCHTGERPYSCSVCGKCFRQNGVLVVHQRIHTGERPYSCAQCGKSYTHKGNLITHQKTHPC